MKNRKNESHVRLGSGTAYEEDRRDPSRELAASGEIDYLIFDCFSEKTLMQAALRQQRGDIGYDRILEAKLRVVVEDCVKHGIKMIFNGGGADVRGAAQRTVESLPGLQSARRQDCLCHGRQRPRSPQADRSDHRRDG